MPSSRVETVVTWGASSAVVLTANTAATSDAFAFNVEDWEATLNIYVDTSGSASSGDYVDAFVSWNMGSITGGGDVFNTEEHSERLGRIDTVATNTPGEDPAGASFHIPTAPKGFKVVVRPNQAATRSQIVRALVTTHRPQ